MSIGRLMFLVLIVALSLAPPQARNVVWAVGMVGAVIAFAIEQRRKRLHPENNRQTDREA